jgi:hypothetical protein
MHYSGTTLYSLRASASLHMEEYMQFVKKGKPPETQYATRPGACAKRREVTLGRPGFEPGRIRTWLSSGHPKAKVYRLILLFNVIFSNIAVCCIIRSCTLIVAADVFIDNLHGDLAVQSLLPRHRSIRFVDCAMLWT